MNPYKYRSQEELDILAQFRNFCNNNRIRNAEYMESKISILRKIIREEIRNTKRKQATEYVKKLVGKRLNERSLKGAVNFEKAKRFRLAQKQDKITWFDNLTYREKQDYYNELKGRKGNLVWITDENKVAIYNKKHN